MSTDSWTPPNAEHRPPKAGEPELHRAARTGEHEAIRRLVGGGADVNAVFDIGLDPGARPNLATPLMVAAGSGDGASVETVRLLIELGADPKLRLGSGGAAEFAASGLGWNYKPGGDAARLAAVLDAGSDVRVGGADGAWLLVRTAESGDAERLRLLLRAGVSPHAWFDAEEAAAEQAAFQKMMDEYKDEHLAEMADLQTEFSYESPVRTGPSSLDIPLFGAASGGSAECVRVLLEAGADPRQLDDTGATALFAARSAGVVRALAAAGTDLHRVNQFGRDALRECIENLGHFPEEDGAWLEVARALLEVGVPLVLPADGERNRLWEAAFSENPAAVRFLLEAGHPATVPAGRQTALHAICWHSDHDDEERNAATREIVRMLLDAGIDPNTRDEEGNTPLHDCVAGDGANLVAAEVLIAAGADVNARNNDGATPLVHLYETHFEYGKVVPFLLKHGADPLIANSRGQNAIDLARAAAAGEEPHWREEMLDELPADHPAQSTGWKAPAEEGDDELRMIELMEKAAKRE